MMEWGMIIVKAMGLYALMGLVTLITIKYISDKD
tara:strand:+ start:428 stop:529 length:102 start_codon:yes stop_codon:yes gene_type:complete